MISTLTAPHLSDLLDRFAARYGEERDPFLPVHVVVPSALVKNYLQLELARRQGFVCNLRVSYLDSFFADLLPKDSRLRLLSRELLLSATLRQLERGEFLQRPECAPLRAYLDANPTPERARCQIAQALARLLADYALTRPELIEAWRRGERTCTADAEWSEVEAWQAALWGELVDEAGCLREGDPEAPALNLPDLLEHMPLDQLELPAEVHVFGFSSFARSYQDLWRALGERCELTCYLLDPSGGSAEGPLGRWSRPTREFAAAWKDVTCERLAPSSSQADVEFVAAPSAQREVEVVANLLWESLRDEEAPPLRFDQVGVAVVDPLWENYRGRIQASFREAHGVPLSVVESGALGERRIAEALALLLDLPLGELSRENLLRFLVHPALQTSLPNVAPSQWLDWCEELKVLRGVAPAEGTYVRRDLYSFGQGVRRLALGCFLDCEGTPPIVRIGGHPYLGHDVPVDRQSSAATLLLAVRSLDADLRTLREASLPLREWSRSLRRLTRAYLDPLDERPALLGPLLGKLASLEALDLDGRPVSYLVAHDFAQRALAGVRAKPSQPLSGGVVVGPLRALAGVPFRRLFVLGLQESVFPARATADPLDLRQAARQQGDLSRRERDELAFSLALTAATERVTLSYVARDDTTGEALEPSPVVRALDRALRERVGDEAADARWRRPPLRRYASAAFPPPLGQASSAVREATPEALREAQARALHEQLVAALPPGAVWPEPGELSDRLSSEARKSLQPLIGLEPLPSTATVEPELRLPLSALSEFLQSPLQAWGKRLLGFREADSGDPLADADEPFATDALTATPLLRQAFFDALDRVPADQPLESADLEAAYEERVLRAQLAGKLPTGVFQRANRSKHLDVLASWLRNLTRRHSDDVLRGLKVYRFGQASRRGASDVLSPPLELTLDLGREGHPVPTRVRLHGNTLPILPEQRGSLLLILAKQPSERHTARAFMDHLVLSAAGLPCEGPFEAVISPGSWANLEHPKHYRALRPFTSEEARDYLRELLTQLLRDSHDALFPIEVTAPFVSAWNAEGEPPGDLREQIQASRNNDWSTDSDDYGPVPQVGRLRPAPRAQELAWRRLAPLVTRRLQPGEDS